MSSYNFNSIAKTSLLTAAMRAKETLNPDQANKLVDDPYAHILAGKEGFDLMEKGIKAAGDQPAIAVRTHFIDNKIMSFVKSGFEQIVILASGMDTRAYRMDLQSSVSVIEIDREEVINYKIEKLQKIKPKCKHTTIKYDLNLDWHIFLKNSAFAPNLSTIWIIEGLLMYLDKDLVDKLFIKLNHIAQKNDVLLLDILSETLLKSEFMKNQLAFLNDIGAPWKFGLNDPESYLLNLGWNSKAIQPGEYAPQRWPFPVAPRNIPNIPRSFFIEAVKIK